MKSCGVITTYMDLRKVSKWWFNIPLLIGQFVFIVMATVYGKIQWDARRPSFVDYTVVPVCIFGIVAFLAGATGGKIEGVITFLLLFFVSVILFVILAVTYREMPLRRVWRAAQCSHVRLCLREKPKQDWLFVQLPEWDYINFGYPKAGIQIWRPGQIDGKRFEYLDPTFEPSPEFIAAMIEYAEAQVGKRYDTLQLFSFGLNFIVWLWPPWWGKEKLKWLNLRHGKEVCSSGIAACLRWPDSKQFFDEYDTAMVSPCLFAIDKNWKET